MKWLIVCWLGISGSLMGTQLSLRSTVLPIYLHGAATDEKIEQVTVPFVSFHADPEWRLAALSTPFIPPTDSSWEPRDVNLTSLYGIKVVGGQIADSADVRVVVDVSAAKVPDDYPFSVQEVTDAVVHCVKLVFPTIPGGGKLLLEVVGAKSSAGGASAVSEAEDGEAAPASEPATDEGLDAEEP